jgi:TonB family protein
MQCVDILHGRERRTVCVDPNQNLSTIEFKFPRIVYEYSDYRPAGKKFIPYRIVAKREGTTLLEASLDKVASDADSDLHLPEPPDGAIKRSGCQAPTPPTLEHSEFPTFPSRALPPQREGRLMLYVLIATDGSVRNAVVTQTAGKALDSSALDAVRHWRYKPAKCGDNAVEFETEVSLNFWVETP